MADDQSEGETGGSTNGVSSVAHDDMDAIRAAYIAGTLDDEKAPAKGKSEPAAREPADDDSDLDEADEDEDSEDDAAEVESKEDDPDADLDEDEESKDDEKDVDDDTKKGIDKVRRTEKRMREQLKKERADAEAELATRAKEVERSLEEKWGKRIESAERFEKLSARVNVDPLGVLQALGMKEDGYEPLAQVMYTLAKAKDDPKAKAAAASLMKERERDDELAGLKKRLEDREKAEKDREAQAAEERQWDAYFDRVSKAGDDKTERANGWLKVDPEAARERMHILTATLAREAGGKIPSERAVMVALEKYCRKVARAMGFDPKSRAAVAAVTEAKPETKAKPAPKAGDKKAPKVESKTAEKTLTKADYISGKFD